MKSLINLGDIDRRLEDLENAINNVLMGCFVRDKIKRTTNSIRVRKGEKRKKVIRIRKERKDRFATCHPDKKHHAKGLCKYCYKKAYRIAHSKTGLPRIIRFSTCHPERKHYIHGQCYQCWNRDRMREYRLERAA